MPWAQHVELVRRGSARRGDVPAEPQADPARDSGAGARTCGRDRAGRGRKSPTAWTPARSSRRSRISPAARPRGPLRYTGVRHGRPGLPLDSRSGLSTKPRTVTAVLDRLLDRSSLPIPREILVVDDGSTDGTRRRARRATASGATRCASSTRRATPGKAPRSGWASPKPAARSSRSRTPTSSSTRRSLPALIAADSRRAGQRGLRVALHGRAARRRRG